MPTWSPDDKEIAFASTRENRQAVWAVTVADRRRAQGWRRAGGRVDAPSWGPDGQIVYHVPTGARTQSRSGVRRQTVALRDRRQADHRQRECVRVSRLVGLADRVLLRLGRQDPQAERRTAARADGRVHGDDAGDAGREIYTRRVRDFTSVTPRQVLGIVRPALSPDGKQIAFAARRRHLRHAGRRQAGQPDQGRRARHRSGVVAGRLAARYSSDKDSEQLQLWIRDMKTGQTPPGDAHDHAAAGRVVVAGRQAHRVLQRRRHVARRARSRSSTSRPAR